VMFHAFEGPPKDPSSLWRWYANGPPHVRAFLTKYNFTGTVYEYGTPEYHNLIPAETWRPGSRAAIVIVVYQVGTVNTACSSIFASISLDILPHYSPVLWLRSPPVQLRDSSYPTSSACCTQGES